MTFLHSLTSKAVLAVVLMSVTGCATPEEIAAMREQAQLERADRLRTVRQRLSSDYGELRDRTFFYDGPSTGSQAAYEYIRELGGSLTDQRSAFYELDIAISVTDRGSDYCYGVVTARLFDNDPPGADWELIAQGTLSTGWPGRCNQPPNRLVYDLLSLVS